jgi:hypothetical protein
LPYGEQGGVVSERVKFVSVSVDGQMVVALDDRGDIWHRPIGAFTKWQRMPPPVLDDPQPTEVGRQQERTS